METHAVTVWRVGFLVGAKGLVEGSCEQESHLRYMQVAYSTSTVLHPSFDSCFLSQKLGLHGQRRFQLGMRKRCVFWQFL